MADFFKNIKSAVVLLDADAVDFNDAALLVERYFRERGIALQLKAVHKRGLFFVRRNVDLFVSLLPEPRCLLSCFARRSRAKFKVGRFQLKRGQVFDLVVSDKAGSPSLQTAVFKQIIYILERIR